MNVFCSIGHIHSIKVTDRVDASQSTYSSEGVPPIKANGLAHINLVTKSEVDTDSIIEPSGLILDSIIAQEVLKDPILYRKANPQVIIVISLFIDDIHYYSGTSLSGE